MANSYPEPATQDAPSPRRPPILRQASFPPWFLTGTFPTLVFLRDPPGSYQSAHFSLPFFCCVVCFYVSCFFILRMYTTTVARMCDGVKQMI